MNAKHVKLIPTENTIQYAQSHIQTPITRASKTAQHLTDNQNELVSILE